MAICSFLISTLEAQSIDSMRVADKSEPFSGYGTPNNEQALKVGCGFIGFFIGAAVGGYVLDEGLIMITGNEKIHLRELGALMGAIVGVYAGVKIAGAISEDKEDTGIPTATLQISPTYDVAQNGLGLGVSLRF